jgi:hypothetical protein
VATRDALTLQDRCHGSPIDGERLGEGMDTVASPVSLDELAGLIVSEPVRILPRRP